MSHAIDGLKPHALWRHFEAISQIPRCSKKEDRIRAYLLDLGRSRGWETATDAVGNVLMSVPAKEGKAHAPVVVLQAHMDMVCEKNRDTVFDFDTQPIALVREGDRITADGTSLGADNGIGIAAALAVADSDLAHGPLEILITTDEETGLVGAFGVKPGFFKGRLMINLDSEELGYLYVGCAGGGNNDIYLPLAFEAPDPGHRALRLDLTGMKGGHSGCDIHQNRGNAIKVLASAVQEVLARTGGRLASLKGGEKHNAIPREAEAVLTVPVEKLSEIDALLERQTALAAQELAPGHRLAMKAVATDLPGRVMTPASARQALLLIAALPHGPLQMSNDIPGLVQTSTNLAVADIRDDELHLQCSPRSSVDRQLDTTMAAIRAVALLAGGRSENEEAYPGWKPDMASPLLKVAREVAQEVAGKPYVVTAIHAGLECGVIRAMVPGVDAISMGPDIRNPHSPDEYVSIPSVEEFYRYLEALLLALAR